MISRFNGILPVKRSGIYKVIHPKKEALMILLGVLTISSCALVEVNGRYSEQNTLPKNKLPHESVFRNSHSHQPNYADNIMFTDFELKIAQKMSLDIRYFCHDKPKKGYLCKESVTELDPLLSDMLKETNVSGVVLFAENLVSTKQIIKLTSDLQKAAMQSPSAKPMFISIDQEGGRVARLPVGTAFSGNMSIGATFKQHGEKYASVVNKVIAKELVTLGFNNNFAPVIDVNTNPDNPVINTRSFGDNPLNVAKQGVAAVNALQQEGIMATLKHFPGHGDTNVDSHLGLPRVNHDLATIQENDLLPFKYAIDKANPAMVMTAHIQYPALDSSTFTNKKGEKIIKPATMSRKILTGILRDEMAFKGIIATDALDMAGIAHFYEPVTATVETFVAGSDLALMPYQIRVPSDISKFKLFIKEVAYALQEKINQKEYSLEELEQSVVRINAYKDKYLPFKSTMTIKSEEQYQEADAVIERDSNKKQQQMIANDATTLIKNRGALIPLATQNIKHIKLIVLDEQDKEALEVAIKSSLYKLGLPSKSIKVSTIVASEKNSKLKEISAKYDMTSFNLEADVELVIAVIDVKIVSIVDMGATSDYQKELKKTNKSSYKTEAITYKQWIEKSLALAKFEGVNTLVIAKGSPYLIMPHLESADACLLIFDDKTYKNKTGQFESAGFNASSDILFGVLEAQGELPVSTH